MGFNLKKWSKHAFRPPKSVRKLQLGHVIAPTLLGFVTGGPGGAVIGAAAGTRKEAGRVAASTNLPVPDTRQPTMSMPDAESRVAPDVPGPAPLIPPLSPTLLIGAGVLLVLVIVLVRRR